MIGAALLTVVEVLHVLLRDDASKSCEAIGPSGVGERRVLGGRSSHDVVASVVDR